MHTHQKVLDAIKTQKAARLAEQRAMSARYRAADADIQEACGRVGHLWGVHEWDGGPVCVICAARAPAVPAPVEQGA